MKKLIIYLFLMIFAFTLTGCRQVDKTANNFKGDIEIAWDDVKDDFNDIDQNIKQVLELVKSMKTLMMHYYGNGDGDYDGAVDDVEQGLENIKGYTEDKWNDFKKQFD